MTDRVYSVRQINSYIKNMFAQDFVLSHISVSGEVSNCKYHSSGHIYFTLKDDSGVISAVMFASYRKGLAFPMKVGDKVVVSGSIRVYERNGAYQIYAERIEPQGRGLLYERFEALKRELEEMGMFDPEYKQPIPAYPKRIGVVTAPTGAAIRDIQNISHRRNPYVQIILYPAIVQGEAAAPSIVSGIHALEMRDVDVIIVGRGGGSMEDLWAFNEEMVARAIFDCPVPIISAVGHETDFTIADYVADLRAPTPSAAAEIAVYDIRRTLQQLESVKYTLNKRMSWHLEQTGAQIRQYQLKLRVADPRNQLMENRQRAADICDSLQSRMERLMTDSRHRLQLAAAALDAASPLKKLESGYAYLATPEDRRITGVRSLAPGDHLRAWLADGSFEATVNEVRVKQDEETL
ncbi:MAG: exodeoxyribonuclease VII large subunit [Clostridiales bacterium]|nr:exodeoxyribonuclease VII large subunit [Clostridiales bacterium]